ncbi:MAG: hypothetical protein QOG06_971, partial [Gaiellaceae bacterium]|nr:hypothetical protein [Gaiellaceae bacterium]
GDHHPADPREPTARIRVANDWIHGVAVEYRSGVGIWGGYLADTTIAHNELADLPYTGISLGWGWGDRDQPPTPAAGNLVEANFVHDVMQALGDGAGIYLLGAQPGTVVRGNVVLHVAGFGGAIYLDDGSRDETVEGNLAFDTHGWPAMLKGQNLTVRDNLWDSYSDWSFYKFDGTRSGERVIHDLAEAPAALLASAGLEQEYRALLRP